MGCKRCKENPVISRRYSGEILCKSCFFKSFEKNAQKELRKQINLLVNNSDIDIRKIGIGLSGGKDSTVALHILKSYVGDRNIEIVGKRLKPNTRYYVFIENQDMSAYAVPKLLPVTMSRGSFSTGDLITVWNIHQELLVKQVSILYLLIRIIK